MFYSMLGVMKNNGVFFMIPEEDGYAILILAEGSREQRRGIIRVDADELQYNNFTLSGEGILSAILATEWEARIVWWRTDRIAGELSP
jgi:hypothetical protein